VLELDEEASIISYEEYYPYGDTSYQAGRSTTEVSQKRYRYTGKEKDDESGLYYHGARYYACWLGRWTATDPAGLVDGVNLYMYCRGNPICFLDDDGKQTADPFAVNVEGAAEVIRDDDTLGTVPTPMDQIATEEMTIDDDTSAIAIPTPPIDQIAAEGTRRVLAVAGSDGISNNNAFINNIDTFSRDNPNDKVDIIRAWEFNSESDLMNAIIRKSNELDGIDVLLIESHATPNSLIVNQGSYNLEKSANWADIKFNEGATITFTGCNAGGFDGVASNSSIAQHVANVTQQTVRAYVNNTSQIGYDKDGNRNVHWRQAAKHYQEPVRVRFGQTVVRGYSIFNPVSPP
jgi:RHS repeat-associated protein